MAGEEGICAESLQNLMQKSCNIQDRICPFVSKNLDVLRFLFLQANLVPVDHDTFESPSGFARPPFIDTVRRGFQLFKMWQEMRNNAPWRFEKGHR